MIPRRGAALAALLLGGCGPHVAGIVQDAATGRPVAGASVELRNTGWGRRDGQLVWDADKIALTRTDAGGRFQFKEDGGVNLRVRASGQMQVDTSLCARSPMIVRVGGPYAALRADRRLLLGPQPGAPSEDLGIAAAPADASKETVQRFTAKGGIRFVEGTGAIPPAPPLPYDRQLDLNLGSACGWLFVSDGIVPIAVVRIGGFGWEQDPGQPRRLVMLYTPLPKR